jgi:hypothetical protein
MAASNPQPTQGQKMVWSGSRVYPDGTRRADDDSGNRQAAPNGSPIVHVPGYSQPLHRHDVAVDFRDAEIPFYRKIRGKHIVGFGVGATLGSTAGSLLLSTLTTGTALGGAGGGAIGAFIGAIVCGIIGYVLAEYVHPSDEDEYWVHHYKSRPYFNPVMDFQRDYEPAYEFGYEMRSDYGGHTFEEVEDKIRAQWERWRHDSRLDWTEARPAILDAWNRYDEVNAEHEVKPQTF